MRILLIGFTKLAYMPYMNFYLEQLAGTDNEIHLIYWNRDGKEEIQLPYKLKYHEFHLRQEDEVPKYKKVKSFLKFRRYAKKKLIDGDYDLLVIMHTIPGVILYDVIKKYYTKKLILDYRDVTFEKIGLYKNVIHKLVDLSIGTFISSNAFRSYLPNKENIFISHNILLDTLKHRDIRRISSRKVNPIKIRYWGFIRHEDINKTIIERLGNDPRFELYYHGREQETARNLKSYCNGLSIKNVFFCGEYTPEERYIFAKETDIIHNIFENDSTMQPAMANKFYDGVSLFIPQICNNGSYMGEQVVKSKIGLECNPNSESFGDEIFNYYNSIYWESFERNCNGKLEEILIEYKNGVTLIKSILDESKLMIGRKSNE